jgi:hypothetical protein
MLRREEYRQDFLSDECRTVRDLILERDNHTCRHCHSSSIALEVYPNYYYGKMPLDTPHEYLITLCKKCHDKAHKGRRVETFKAPSWLPIKWSRHLTRQRIKDLKKRNLLINKLRIRK